MRGRIFHNLDDATVYLADLNTAARYPTAHQEGPAPGDFQITRSGRAADRLRRRRIRTESLAQILSHPMDGRYAVAASDDEPDELDESWRSMPTSRTDE